MNVKCVDNARGMIRHGRFLGYSPENTNRLYWVVDGKVWQEEGNEITMIGDYFEFMEETRNGTRAIWLDEIVGTLHDKATDKFTCMTCNPTGTPVFRINIGLYSQVCSSCKKVIVEGVKKKDGSPLSLFD